MKKLDFNKLRRYLPFLFIVLALLCCTMAIADVGNQNRYSSGDGGGSGGGSGDWGVIIGYLIGLMIDNPVLGMIVLVILVVVVFPQAGEGSHCRSAEFP